MLKSLIGILTFLPLIAWAVHPPIDLPKAAVQDEFYGFHFSPGRLCTTNWIDPTFCESVQPISWRSSEIEVVKYLLRPLLEGGKLPRFFQQIFNNGFDHFFRYTWSYEYDRKLQKFIRAEKSSVVAWVSASDLSINLTSLGLGMENQFDPIGKFNLAQKGLLHELVHAFDYQPEKREWGSKDPTFLKLAGWEKNGSKWQLKAIGPKWVEAMNQEAVNLSASGKLEEAFRLNRESAVRNGFPSLYAMTNPTECFAEMAAYVYLDPMAPEYLKPELIKWFSKNVLN